MSDWPQQDQLFEESSAPYELWVTLADYLRAAQVPVRVINGQTPAAERQPLTEQFRRWKP